MTELQIVWSDLARIIVRRETKKKSNKEEIWLGQDFVQEK